MKAPVQVIYTSALRGGNQNKLGWITFCHCIKMKNAREWAPKAQAYSLKSFLCSFLIRSNELEKATSIWVSSGLCKHIHFLSTEAQERTCVLGDKDISLLSTSQFNPHTMTSSWALELQFLQSCAKPRFLLSRWGVRLLWALHTADGETAFVRRRPGSWC